MTLQEGNDRISDAKKLAEAVIADFREKRQYNPSHEAAYKELKGLTESQQLNNLNPETILRALGVAIRRKYARTFTVATDAEDSVIRLIAEAKVVWQAVMGSGAGSIQRPRDVQQADWGNVKDFLSAIGLGRGIQKSGDFALPDTATQEDKIAVEEANQESAKASEADKTALKQRKDAESTNYPLFKTFLENWIRDEYESQETIHSEVIISGSQRGDSEWSTPDITGVVVLPGKNIGSPIIRVFTIEVKFDLDLQAIAEASAHRRLSHYSYVGVFPQDARSVTPELTAELARAGIGLICPAQANSATLYAILGPQFHNPDEEELDYFLGYFRSEEEQGHTLGSRVRGWCTKALGLILAA